MYQGSPEGKAAVLDTVRSEELAENGGRQNNNEQWHRIDATEDSKKRVWFWSNNLDGTYGGAYINGLLFFNGSKIDYLGFGPPVENMSIGIIANKDASHCWVGMVTNGLYQMDLETFGFTPVPEPSLRSFDSIYSMFSVGADWYLANGANTMVGQTQLTGDLW